MHTMVVNRVVAVDQQLKGKWRRWKVLTNNVRPTAAVSTLVSLADGRAPAGPWEHTTGICQICFLIVRFVFLLSDLYSNCQVVFKMSEIQFLVGCMYYPNCWEVKRTSDIRQQQGFGAYILQISAFFLFSNFFHNTLSHLITIWPSGPFFGNSKKRCIIHQLLLAKHQNVFILGNLSKTFQRNSSVKGVPPPLLTENQSEKKKVFFLSGKGGYPPLNGRIPLKRF